MATAYASIILYFYIPLFTIDLSIFIRFMHKLFYSMDPNIRRRRISLIQQRLHLICFTAVILSSICDMIHAFGSIITHTKLDTDIEWILASRIMADIFYHINTTALYIILVHRLHTIFNKSMYQISTPFLWLIACFISFQCAIMISYNANTLVFNCHTALWCKMKGIQSAIITLNDYILNALLFVLFIKKLRQLVAMRVRYDSMINFDKHSQQGNERNIRLLDTITKQCIIGVSLTFINQLFATTVFAIRTWKQTTHWDPYLVEIYLIRGAEGVFVCGLLYLGLQFNNNEYMKICRICHNECYDCILRHTKAKRTTTDKYYQF